MIPYEQLLLDLVQSDERIVIITAENRGHMRSLPSLIGDRFIDVGIAEQTMIGVAAGMALRGRIPIVHALASFVTLRPFEFIRDDVGIAGLPVIMVGMVPGVLSDGNGPTHQAIDDVQVMRGIPNVNVFCPADTAELIAGLPELIKAGGAWYVRYLAGDPVIEHHEEFVVGKAETVVDCDAPVATILTYGYLTRTAIEAASLLATNGIATRVVNMRTLKPVDADAIVRAAKESRVVVTLEDHFRTGGLRSIVAETLLDARLTASVLSIDFGHTWFTPGRLGEVLDHHGLTPDHVCNAIAHHVEHSGELIDA